MGGELTAFTGRRRWPCPGRSRVNDAIPRAASSVRATAAKASCSMLRPSASVPSSPRSTAPLARPCAQDGTGRELAGPPERGLQDGVGRGDSVHQPDRERLLGPHLAPREDELFGPRRTDEPGQALGAAPTGDHPEEHLGQAEAGVFGADAEVAGQCELQPAAQGVAVDRCDGRPRDRRQGAEPRAKLAPTAGAPDPSSSTMSAPAAKIRRPPRGPLRPVGRRGGTWPCRGAGRGPRRTAHWPWDDRA